MTKLPAYMSRHLRKETPEEREQRLADTQERNTDPENWLKDYVYIGLADRWIEQAGSYAAKAGGPSGQMVTVQMYRHRRNGNLSAVRIPGHGLQFYGNDKVYENEGVKDSFTVSKKSDPDFRPEAIGHDHPVRLRVRPESDFQDTKVTPIDEFRG